MGKYDTKVIGFFAYASPTEVFCTDNISCLIIGSESNMKKYLQEIDPNQNKRHTIKKTRFGEIISGLRLGGSYAFDEESYIRFYPYAKEEGLNVQPFDFRKDKPKDMRFLTVKIIDE